MRLVICSSMRPFEHQSRATAERLADACRHAGHEVEVVYLPWADGHEIRQLAAYRWIDLASSSELVICLDRPALVLAHPRKVVWMTRAARCVSCPADAASTDAARRDSRAVVRNIERAALSEARAVYENAHCSSQPTAYSTPARVLRLPAEPPHDRERVTDENEFVCLGPITTASRVEVLIDAMGLVRGAARVRWLGHFEDPGFEAAITARVQAMRVGDRVIFDQRTTDVPAALSRATAVIQMATCCDEVFVAAARQARVVLASAPPAADGFARETAQVVEPSAEALARAMDALSSAPARARQLGNAAFLRLGEMLPTWDAVAKQLLQ